MPIEQTAQTRLEPNILQVESLGIGLYRTNDTLNLASNQFLVVGEGTVGNNPSLVQHNVIIDNTGMAINASLTERDTAPNRGYALYVKGDLMVEGSIRGNQFTSNPPANINSDRFWAPVSYNINNNIYSTNQVSISTELQARSNTHKLNVVATPNRDIQRAHLNLQNTELAQLRVGILGNAPVSPVVFNTTSNVPIEFHVGRDRAYFSNVYTQAVFGNPSNLLDLNTPNYTGGAAAPPNLIIDAGGDVGIHTSQSQTLTYLKNLLQVVSTPTGNSNTYYTSNIRDRMGLYVSAPLYAEDLLIYDVFTGAACNIDTLFVRSAGQTLEANQIRPGTFAYGTYTFASNLRINDGLTVASNAVFQSNLTVQGTLYGTGETVLSNLTVIQQATAERVVGNQVVYASNVLRFGSFLQTIGPDGQWCNVDFNISNPSGFSNIEEIGGNVFIRNRAAVGLNLSNADEAAAVFHQQFHVEKTATNRYELELWDRTLQPWNRKVAVLGHADLDANRIYKDASFVIATGTPTEDFYNGVKVFQSLPELPQNIYFYPGQYEHGNVYRPLIREDNPPVLGVFYNNRVGLGTYRPQETLHIEGNTFTTGDYYIRHPSLPLTRAPLAKFYQNNAIGRTGIPSVFAGAEYINAAAPRVGINTTAQYDYGMVVAGGLKLVDAGLYTPTDQRVGLWLQNTTDIANPTIYAPAAQTIGIGVSTTVYPLEVYNTGTTRPTYINIQANQVEVEAAPNYSKGGLRLNALNQTWVMEAGVPYANRTYVKQSFAVYDTRTPRSNVLLAGQYFVSEGRHQLYVGDIYDAGDYGPSNSTYDDSLIVGGNATVFGSLKITSNLEVDGLFNLRGTSVQIAAGGTSATPVPLSANPKDVFITGSVVHLLPAATSPDSTFVSPSQSDPGREAYVSVGYTQDTDITLAQKSDLSTYPILRVHQYINSLTIARFSSSRPYALFDLETGRSGADVSARMRYGLDYSEGTASLVFIDRTVPSQPKYFLKSTRQVDNTIYTGLNLPTTVAPTANLHIYNGDTGENMVRVNYVSTIDSSVYAPTVQLHRDNTSTSASYQWELRGPRPDTLQPLSQKLSFNYRYDQPGQTSSNVEVLTLLSDGKVGINQSSPNYALDLRCSAPHHAIRLYSPTSSSTGMLLFQAGPSNTFGADAALDYRMYASNSGFYMDQQGTSAGLVRCWTIDSNANMGIRTDTNSNYAVNIGGYLNVSDGILINGFPFLYRQSTSNIITGGIRVDDLGNIFINPASFNYINEPGLVIGAGVATSNLLHIYSGCNANLTVYDSIYEEAQVHFRTRSAVSGSNSTYRLFSSNQKFQLEYNPTHSAVSKITDSHTGYTPLVSWDLAPDLAAAPGANFAIPTSNLASMTLRGDLVFQSGATAAGLQFPSGSHILGASNGDVVISAGNIGIGTTVPLGRWDLYGTTSNIAQPLFRATQNGIAPLAVFQGSNAAAVFTLTADGAVGIGTTAPASKLHVEDTVYSRDLLPLGAAYSLGSQPAPWESLYLSSNLQLGDTVLRTPTPNLSSGDDVETLRIQDRATGALTPRLQVREWMVGEANGGGLSLHVVGVEGSNLAFINSNLTAGGGIEVSRRIPLLYSPTTRRVGIHSDTPSAHLEVVGASNEPTAPLLALLDSNASAALVVSPMTAGAGRGAVGVGIGTTAPLEAAVHLYVPPTAASNLIGLHVRHEAPGSNAELFRLETAASNILRVLPNGRVGFGTTTPAATVHIQGDLYASGTLTASNINVINLNTTDVEITFSEQVSITNTGTDTALKVVQTGNAPMVELQYGAMGDPKITALTITSNGLVGIGTTAPAAALHVPSPILYRNAYANVGALPTAASFPGMVAGVLSNVGSLYTPYYTDGASWSPLAFYQDILNAIEDRKGLKFTLNQVVYTPASNLLMSGDGLFGANSNSPELHLYRGMTYRFSNVAAETYYLTSNAGGGVYVGIDLGLTHDNAGSNALLTEKYKVRSGDQVRFTVPMDAVAGSNYRYELELDSNVYGVLNIA